MVPLGKARVAQNASDEAVENGESIAVITYGMGVYWAKSAAKQFDNQIEILDLRTLSPCDDEAIFEQVRKHGKVLVLTEETITNSFAESIAGRISKNCFESLDAPVQTMGSIDTPAVPMNMGQEKVMLPNADKVASLLREMLDY